MTRKELIMLICPHYIWHDCNEQVDCGYCNEKMNHWLDEYDKQIRAEVIDEELQNFAQWLWDSRYLTDEAFTIRLVEQYKDEQLKEQKNK